MKKGRVSLEYTLGGFLLAGLSYLVLFFRAEGEPRRTVLSKYEKLRAARCESCGAVVIVPDASQPDLGA